MIGSVLNFSGPGCLDWFTNVTPVLRIRLYYIRSAEAGIHSGSDYATSID